MQDQENFEFNNKTVPRNYNRANEKATIRMHSKAGTISFNKNAAELIGAKQNSKIKFMMIESRLYVSTTPHADGFEIRSKFSGELILSHSALARKLMDVVEKNLYSVTLEVEKTEEGYFVNTEDPLRVRKGAPV